MLVASSIMGKEYGGLKVEAVRPQGCSDRVTDKGGDGEGGTEM